MNSYKIQISLSAQMDLKDIVQQISLVSQRPNAARKQLDRIKETISKLSLSPERHGLVKEGLLAVKGIRAVPVGAYLVFYVVSTEQRTVSIVRILHNRRNWQDIL